MDDQIIDLGPFDEVIEIRFSPRKGVIVSFPTTNKEYDGSIRKYDYFHFLVVAHLVKGDVLWRVIHAVTTTIQIGGASYSLPILDHSDVSSVMPGGAWIILPYGTMMTEDKIGSEGKRITQELYGVRIVPAGSPLTAGWDYFFYLGHSASPHPLNGTTVTYRAQ